MAFKDGNSPSLAPKLLLVIFTLLGVVVALKRALFGFEDISPHNWMLISCTLIFYIRLVISLFIFIRRKVSWFEGVTVGILYGIMVAAFSDWGLQNSPTSIFLDITGMVFFLIGSYVNSLSDYQRHKWKTKTENHRHLYIWGFFRYAMHINYFGDSLMFMGFAMVTQNVMSFLPVSIIILNFIFLQIPLQDAHLKNKYGFEFLEYERKTKKFIPLIY